LISFKKENQLQNSLAIVPG